MSTKLALILTGTWTVLVIGASVAAISFVAARVPRHQQEARAQRLGSGVAVAASVGYGASGCLGRWREAVSVGRGGEPERSQNSPLERMLTRAAILLERLAGRR